MTPDSRNTRKWCDREDFDLPISKCPQASESTAESCRTTALELTGQKGVDHVLEVVGGDNLSRSITATKTGGQISVIGILRGITSTIELSSVLQKQVVLRGIGGAGHRRAF